jgi:hypothetical protein
MASNERRLPIKVVLTQDEDLQAKPGRGSARKVFDEEALDQQRADLLGQIAVVRSQFGDILQRRSHLPAVARVILKKEALAKSHRPTHLFEKGSCPIIGGEDFGHLLVSVTKTGLDELEKDVARGRTGDLKADVSTLRRIEPYTADDAAGDGGVAALQRVIAERRPNQLRIRLFRHDRGRANDALREEFLALARALKLEVPESLPYLADLRLYRVRGITPDVIPALASFVGTQSIGLVPEFEVTAQYIPVGQLKDADFPSPAPGIEYPVVGLIDSGTDPMNRLLQAWVVDRDEEDVPRADQDNAHGSFVAGLIANGFHLNHQDPQFPRTQCRIVDVVAVPKATTPLTEDDLLNTIRRVVKKYPQVKVWNLSLSRKDMVCCDDAFSEFGMELDRIQQKYDVTFVSCAGNFEVPPLRGWPPEDLGESDRIHPPADSALGVSVGAVAHVNRPNSRVKQRDPSPFSRRGPGAAFLPKPEVGHIGGNCDGQLNYRQVGVLSLSTNGQVCEAIGTSFSTPIVSSILASIRSGTASTMSRTLAKALLVHSAALRHGPIDAAELRYRGFGVPGDLSDVLTCPPWQATLIFEPELQPSKKIFARADFPIPKCFRRPDGRVEGEFLMTLVYDPPLSPNAGAEYCQTNVDVSLGTYDVGKDGKAAHESKIPLEPRDYSKLYEQHLVEHGFKWSPVKVYRKALEATGGQRWRLVLNLLYRATAPAAEPQRAALVVTLFDPARQKPVYDEVVRAMRTSGWSTVDLQVRPRLQARGRG